MLTVEKYIIDEIEYSYVLSLKHGNLMPRIVDLLLHTTQILLHSYVMQSMKKSRSTHIMCSITSLARCLRKRCDSLVILRHELNHRSILFVFEVFVYDYLYVHYFRRNVIQQNQQTFLTIPCTWNCYPNFRTNSYIPLFVIHRQVQFCSIPHRHTFLTYCEHYPL